jgi:CRISPR-associated protein Cmr4
MSFLPPEKRTYLFQTLDPLHVGTGGTRLGRVDNTVARDPATRLPKVPGSGLSGAVKDAYDLKLCNNGKTTRCAGAHGCGREDCKVCTLFGTAPSDEAGGVNNNKAQRGIMAFHDALLVAMPVASLLGPVWVVDQKFAAGLGLITGELTKLPSPDIAAPSKLKAWEDKVNIGSFLFPCNSDVAYKDSTRESLTEKIEFFTSSGATADDFCNITDNMVACHPSVFPLIVDTAMEVRTSVTINPYTGAAEEHKLFTLEAVPAGAVFQTELGYLGGKYPDKAFGGTHNTSTLFEDIENNGFPYLAYTGMGGNVTRGFGRVRFLGYFRNGGA